jgi:hypothetical protein
MCVTSSPLAIPHLLKIGVYDPEQILPCLAKFRVEPSAAAAVLHQVRNGRANSVVSALEVLGGRRQALSVAEFDQLMQSPQFAVRSAALQYAAAIRERGYLDVVRKHARDDPDPEISKSAQHIQSLLEMER